jgi:hypothetical protein
MIERLSQQCPIAIYRSQMDNKWRFVAYQQSPSSDKYFTHPDGTTYRWKYSEDMIDPTVSFTPVEDCINEVHILYSMYAPTGQFTKDCWVGPSGSDTGIGSRDQNAAAPNNREALAADSRDDYNVKGVLRLECDAVTQDSVARVLRDYYFDRYRRPRLVISFLVPGGRAETLESGMATIIDNELQDYIPCPWYPGPGGSGKAWADLIFFVREIEMVSDTTGVIRRVTLEEIS